MELQLECLLHHTKQPVSHPGLQEAKSPKGIGRWTRGATLSQRLLPEMRGRIARSPLPSSTAVNAARFKSRKGPGWPPMGCDPSESLFGGLPTRRSAGQATMQVACTSVMVFLPTGRSQIGGWGGKDCRGQCRPLHRRPCESAGFCAAHWCELGLTLVEATLLDMEIVCMSTCQHASSFETTVLAPTIQLLNSLGRRTDTGRIGFCIHSSSQALLRRRLFPARRCCLFYGASERTFRSSRSVPANVCIAF